MQRFFSDLRLAVFRFLRYCASYAWPIYLYAVRVSGDVDGARGAVEVTSVDFYFRARARAACGAPRAHGLLIIFVFSFSVPVRPK